MTVHMTERIFQARSSAKKRKGKFYFINDTIFSIKCAWITFRRNISLVNIRPHIYTCLMGTKNRMLRRVLKITYTYPLYKFKYNKSRPVSGISFQLSRMAHAPHGMPPCASPTPCALIGDGWCNMQYANTHVACYYNVLRNRPTSTAVM